MRCAPGDLVLVVRDHTFPANCGRYGTIVAPVIEVDCTRYGEWWVAPAGLFWGEDIEGEHPEERAVVTSFFDDELFPIKRPGEQETDETLVPGYVDHELMV